MYTSHGHQIPGTTIEKRDGPELRCGGVSSCPKCAGEAWHATLVKETPNDNIRKVSYMDNVDPVVKAKGLAVEYYNARRDSPEIAELTLKDAKIVQFNAYTRGWNAIVRLNIPDTKIYKLVYNGYLSETIVDEFARVGGVTVADER